MSSPRVSPRRRRPSLVRSTRRRSRRATRATTSRCTSWACASCLPPADRRVVAHRLTPGPVDQGPVEVAGAVEHRQGRSATTRSATTRCDGRKAAGVRASPGGEGPGAPVDVIGPAPPGGRALAPAPVAERLGPAPLHATPHPPPTPPSRPRRKDAGPPAETGPAPVGHRVGTGWAKWGPAQDPLAGSV